MSTFLMDLPGNEDDDDEEDTTTEVILPRGWICGTLLEQ